MPLEIKSYSKENQNLKSNCRIIWSASRNINIRQRHVGHPNELKEKETAWEIVDDKQSTMDGFGRGFLLKYGDK